MTEPRDPSAAGILATIGVAATAVLCCAGTALLTGGVLSGLGSALRSRWLTIIGVVLLVAAAGYTVIGIRGRRRHDCGPTCYPPHPRLDAAHGTGGNSAAGS